MSGAWRVARRPQTNAISRSFVLTSLRGTPDRVNFMLNGDTLGAFLLQAEWTPESTRHNREARDRVTRNDWKRPSTSRNWASSGREEAALLTKTFTGMTVEYGGSFDEGRVGRSLVNPRSRITTDADNIRISQVAGLGFSGSRERSWNSGVNRNPRETAMAEAEGRRRRGRLDRCPARN